MDSPSELIKENTTIIVQFEMNLNRCVYSRQWHDAAVAARALASEYTLLAERCTAIGDSVG